MKTSLAREDALCPLSVLRLCDIPFSRVFTFQFRCLLTTYNERATLRLGLLMVLGAGRNRTTVVPAVLLCLFPQATVQGRHWRLKGTNSLNFIFYYYYYFFFLGGGDNNCNTCNLRSLSLA